ncbi:glycosyltransferase [Pseudonocardia sp.]|uniref:glycosyltransferase n=1 Tax=Pseudonocardia sp. TaxID=60912 RepID=UPI003D1168FF
MLSALVVAVSLILFAFSSVTLWWMLHAWRTPETLAATRFRAAEDEPGLRFSLLVPARHEELVLGHTVRALVRSRHPDFEVIVIVGHDDPGTAEVAEALAREFPGQVQVVVDHHLSKNKPRALNSALPACRGDVVGVFDAEDVVHPDLLRHVDHTFRHAHADVVQGGVQLVNFQSSWYSLRNCLEYYFWFRSRLHLQAAKGFIPLGGNTVFVRADLLREAGGWDPDCLAEDCDLGVRLSSAGARVVVSYDPVLVTREETPDSLQGLMRQRTRWNQGFIQVFRKGDWRRLDGVRPRMLARYTLATPFLQAFTGLTIPVGILIGLTTKVPILVALLSFLPLLPTLAVLAFEVVGLHDFGRQYRFPVRPVHYAKLVVGAPAYQVVLAYAALRAVWRESRGRADWELTSHVGAHLPAPRSAPAAGS